MLSIEELIHEVESSLRALSFRRAPYGLYEPIEYSLSLGGKRIRPVMCLATCALFTDNYKTAMPAALAIEVFHNFTLLHDDVMDNALIRRNKPTVHAKWNANTAILSGDQMLIEAYKLMAQTDSPASALILSTFSQTATEVCEGQQYDMEFEAAENVTIDQYMEMIRLKTSVLLAGSIKIGAMIGGATDSEIERLYQFGNAIGLAFQLQDDLLDTFGDEATFGKAIGGDIMENKKTYLLISALEHANATQKRELMQWINAENPNRDEKISAVRQIYNATGVKQMTEDKIEALHNQALEILREMDIAAEGKRFFTDFANSLIKRTR